MLQGGTWGFMLPPSECYFRFQINKVDWKHLLISVYCSQPSKVTFKRVFFKGIHPRKTKRMVEETSIDKILETISKTVG